MYTRTHTHTQARTHTTKFSGHVVRFCFFSLFSFLLFAIRVSTRRKLFGAPILYSTGGTQKQAQSSHTIVTSQHRCTHIRSASPSRDKHSPSRAESRYIHYGATPLFFFPRGPKVCGHGEESSVTWGGLAREIQQHACYYITRRFQRCTYSWKNVRQHAQRQNTHAQWMKITM